ncbi:hypothetical protein [Streptomyces sp. NBC_01485]|uniref:hypothetical protein n=1 Tax=Streptomyces sp. NBC_01485 TaxID=2903884 RepID=UPI003FCC38E2
MAAERIPGTPEAAADLYLTLCAGRRMLVVPDNAADAEQVRPLLPGGPGCVVLVTSRDRLAGLAARDGARRIGVDVLAPRSPGCCCHARSAWPGSTRTRRPRPTPHPNGKGKPLVAGAMRQEPARRPGCRAPEVRGAFAAASAVLGP